MKPDLFVRWHLGLGDAIICNGLVRALVASGRYASVTVPVKRHNRDSVEAMFADEPCVMVQPFAPAEPDVDADHFGYLWAERGPVLRLGMFAPGFDRHNWARSFYAQAGVPLRDRWDQFKVGDWGDQFRAPSGLYAVLHEGGSQGGARLDETRLPNLSKGHLTPQGTLWQWRAVLEAASEIHCIDSSVACLVDMLQENGQRLVLHKYARNSVPPDYRRKWEILS